MKPKSMKPNPPNESIADVDANSRLRELSGRIRYPSTDWLTGFLYVLLRDVSPPGEVERIVRELERETSQGLNGETTYTNGWLAQYAKDLADRLRAIEQRARSPE